MLGDKVTKAKKSNNIMVSFEMPAKWLEKMEVGVEEGIGTKIDELFRMAVKDFIDRENLTIRERIIDEQKKYFAG